MRHASTPAGFRQGGKPIRKSARVPKPARSERRNCLAFCAPTGSSRGRNGSYSPAATRTPPSTSPCSTPHAGRPTRRLVSPRRSASTRCGIVLRRIYWNRAPISGSSKPCSKQRQTARQQPVEGRITYPFHPRSGEAVLILRRYAYRGTELVVIPQPDGSVACIPAWMTQEAAAHVKLSAEPRFSLEILRSLRAEIDALLSFLQSDSKREKEGNDAKNRRSRKSAAGTIRSGGAGRCAGGAEQNAAGDAGGSAADRDCSGTRSQRRRR